MKHVYKIFFLPILTYQSNFVVSFMQALYSTLKMCWNLEPNQVCHNNRCLHFILTVEFFSLLFCFFPLFWFLCLLHPNRFFLESKVPPPLYLTFSEKRPTSFLTSSYLTLMQNCFMHSHMICSTVTLSLSLCHFCI